MTWPWALLVIAGLSIGSALIYAAIRITEGGKRAGRTSREP